MPTRPRLSQQDVCELLVRDTMTTLDEVADASGIPSALYLTWSNRLALCWDCLATTRQWADDQRCTDVYRRKARRARRFIYTTTTQLHAHLRALDSTRT